MRPPRLPNLTRQSACLLAGEGAGKLAYLAAFVLTARHLGPEALGALTFAYTGALILGVVFDLGLAKLGTRELAACSDNRDAERLLGQLLALKTAGALLIAASMMAAPLFLPVPAEALTLLYPLGLFAAAGSVAELLYGGLRALGAFRVEATVKTAARAGALLLVAGLLYTGHDLPALAWALAAAPVSEAALGLCWLSRRGVTPRLTRPLWELTAILRRSSALALLPLLTLLYVSGDLLLLAALRPVDEVGLYSGAYRLLDAFVLLPAAVAGALLPRLSRADDPAQAQDLTVRALGRLLPVAALVAAAISFAADPLAAALLGDEMRASASALPWLAWSGAAICLHYVMGTALIAAGRESVLVKIVGLAAAANLAANTWTIPAWGFVGAAATTLFTEVALALIVGWAWALGRRETLPVPSAGRRLRRFGWTPL